MNIEYPQCRSVNGARTSPVGQQMVDFTSQVSGSMMADILLMLKTRDSGEPFVAAQMKAERMGKAAQQS